MAKGSCSSGPTLRNPFTVFIDTNLETHLAMIVSEEETVHDLKQRIMNEHPCCFPNIGEITIKALKVKRKGFFYHLSDSMLVKGAFEGVNRTWYLYVDAATRPVEPILNGPFLEPSARDTPKRLRLEHPSNTTSAIDSLQLRQAGSSYPLLIPHDDQSVSHGIACTHTQQKKDKSEKGKEMQVDDILGETPPIGAAKKYSDSGVLKKNDSVDVIGTNTQQEKEKTETRMEMLHDDNLGETLPVSPTSLIPALGGKRKKDVLGTTSPLEPPTKKKRENESRSETASLYLAKDPSRQSDAGNFVLGKETSKADDIILDSSVDEGLQTRTSKNEKHKNKKKDQDLIYSRLEDPMNENNVGTDSKKDSSERENKVFEKENDTKASLSKKKILEVEKSLEDQGKATVADLSVEPPEKSVGKKKKTKKKSVMVCDNSEVLLSNENVRQERSKEALDNNLREFGEASDALPLSSKEALETPLSACVTNLTVTSEKEGEGDQVQELREASVPHISVVNAPYRIAEKSAISDVSIMPKEVGHIDGSKVPSQKDDPEQALTSARKKTKRGKKHKTANSEALPTPLAVDFNDITREIKTLIPDAGVPDDDNIGTDMTVNDEGKEKSLKHGGDATVVSPETAVYERGSSARDETATNVKHGAVLSNLPDAAYTTKSGDPSDKRGKLKKGSTKASDTRSRFSALGENHVNSVDAATPFESDKGFDGDHLGADTNNEGTIMSQAETELNVKDRIVLSKSLGSNGVTEARDPSNKRKKKKANTSDPTRDVSSSGALDAPSVILDKEADKVNGSVVDSLRITKITGGQETAGSGDHKLKRKNRKKIVSEPESYTCPEKEEKAVRDAEPTSSVETKEANASSRKLKKSKMGKRKVNQSDSNFEEKDRHDIGSADRPSNTLECNVEGIQPLEDSYKGDAYLGNGSTNETNGHIEVPNIEGVNFNEYFLPKPVNSEVVAPEGGPVDKAVVIKKSDKKLKANKKTKRVSENSVGSVADVHMPQNSNNDQGIKKHSEAIADTTEVPLAEDDQGKPAPQPEQKSYLATKSAVMDQRNNPETNSNKVSRSKKVDASGNTTRKEVQLLHSSSRTNDNLSTKASTVIGVAPTFHTGSSVGRVQKNKGHSKLELQANDRHGTAKKFSSNPMGEVVNNSNPKKSLFATSNTIFQDSSDESSQDEGETSVSQASAKSPDNSSSSDFSEGESVTNLDTPGSYGGESKEIDSRIASESQDKQHMSLDIILRGSRSYKKAKLTASQDPDNQPIDFVLDSQVD